MMARCALTRGGEGQQAITEMKAFLLCPHARGRGVKSNSISANGQVVPSRAGARGDPSILAAPDDGCSPARRGEGSPGTSP